MPATSVNQTRKHEVRPTLPLIFPEPKHPVRLRPKARSFFLLLLPATLDPLEAPSAIAIHRDTSEPYGEVSGNAFDHRTAAADDDEGGGDQGQIISNAISYIRKRERERAPRRPHCN